MVTDKLTMENKNNEPADESSFSQGEQQLLTAAFKKMEEKIDISSYDQEKSYKEIERKLGLKKLEKEIKREGWIQKLSKYFSATFGMSIGMQASSVTASVFAIGIVFGLYVNNGPSYGPSSRNGSADILRNKQGVEKIQAIPMVKSDPIGFINLVVESGLDAGVEMKTAKVDSVYLIVVSGLKVNSEKQAGLKAILGLDSSQEGEVFVEISTDKK